MTVPTAEQSATIDRICNNAHIDHAEIDPVWTGCREPDWLVRGFGADDNPVGVWAVKPDGTTTGLAR